MLRLYRPYILVFFIIFWLTPATETHAHGGSAPHVLVLHSYHPNYEWTRKIGLGIQEQLNLNFPGLAIHVEYLDTKQYFQPGYVEQVVEPWLLQKLAIDRSYDLVITSDNDAFDFALKYRDPLFVETPIVFCGLNNFSPEILQEQTGITGVAEHPSHAQTLALALALRPETTHVLTINSTYSKTHQSNAQTLKAVLEEQAKNLKVEYLVNASLDEAIAKVETLPKTAIILLNGLLYEPGGERLIPHDITFPRLTESAEVPIFSFWDFYIGRGVIGGQMISALEQGRMAGQMALDILNGTDPDSIPVKDGNSNKVILDYKVMERFGVKLSQVPDGAIIRNKPRSVRMLTRLQTGALIGALCSSLLILAVTVIRKRRVESQFGFIRKRYQQLFQNSKDAIYILNLEGHFLDTNDIACKALGYSHEQMLNLTPLDLLTEPGKADFHPNMESIIRDGHISFEADLLSSTGEIRPWQMSCHLIDFHNRQAILAIGRDISEKVAAEKALQKSEAEQSLLLEQFEALFNGIPDPLLLLDENKTVDWANRAVTTVLDLPLEDVLGATCNELFYQSSASCRDCIVNLCFESGEESSARAETPDGRIWSARAYPILDQQGSVRRVIKHMQDITTSVKLEAETARTGQLASIGELAAGVAHEINNPINGIINYAQILINEADKVKADCDISQRILHEGDRIAKIVGNLLSFARDPKNDRAPVRMNQVVHDALALVGTQLQRDNINFSLDLPSDLPFVFGNRQQLQQVIINLLSNARYALNSKYPQPDPEKRLNIHIFNLAEDQKVRLVLQDQGTGIPEDILERITNPFFSTKPSGEGTGLGLSISQRIILEHNGFLGFESESGRFTRVVIELPAS